MNNEIKNEEMVNYDKEIKVIFYILLFIATSYFFLWGVPNYLRSMASRSICGCLSNMKRISTALNVYSEVNNGEYPKKLEMLTPGYLDTIPECPGPKEKIFQRNKNSIRYSNTYTVSPDFKNYTFYCPGNNHEGAGRQKDYPQCSSRFGIVIREKDYEE